VGEKLSLLSFFEKSIGLCDFLDRSRWEWALALASPEILRELEKNLEASLEIGARIVYPGHREYPRQFFELENPPLFLSVLGASSWRDRNCIAIVGSREPTRNSLNWLEHHLPVFFEKRPQSAVVSGGARGIDQKAHALAIRANIPTIVFLPSGLKQMYPSEIMDWKEPILQSGGAIVSQFLPNQTIRKMHFEGRNRLIACIGRMLFVAEAKRRSGSLMTARLARELSREIAVLPAFPGEVKTGGCVDLLYDGVQPIRDAEDLLTFFDLNSKSAPSATKTEECGN
jgi:DNA processing protein